MAFDIDKPSSRAIGRPTIKTEEMVKKLEEVFRLGVKDSTACAHAGISRQTFYLWQQEDDDFSDRMETAKSYALLVSKQIIVKQLADKDEDIAKRTELAKWYLERYDTKQASGMQNTQVNVFNQIREEFLKKNGEIPTVEAVTNSETTEDIESENRITITEQTTDGGGT